MSDVDQSTPIQLSDGLSSRHLVEIARLYYERNMTQREIAQAFGLSRVRVTRLLAEARQRGIVEIRIHGDDAPPFAELAARLAAQYGLEHVLLAPTFDDPQRTAGEMANTGAQALYFALDRASAVAVGLSRTLGAAIRELSPLGRGHTLFVPLAGGWSGAAEGLNPEELTAHLASLTGGHCYHLLAPLLAETPAVARSLRESPGVAEALRRAASADTLITGVGGLDWTESALAHAITAAERQQLERAGAVGDTSARFFDAEGHAVASTLEKRVVGLTLPQMTQIPTRLVIAHGSAKVTALHSALTGGLATHLVTDVATARTLLGEAGTDNV